MELKEKLVDLRKKKALSQAELAEEIKVSRQTISRWEIGAVTPSTENLKYLGSLYNVPLDYLINDDAPEPVNEVRDIKKEEQPRDVSIIRRSAVLILIEIVLFGAILCTIFFMNRGEEIKKMDDIEGSEIRTEEIFKVEW